MKLQLSRRSFNIDVDYLGGTTRIGVEPLNPEEVDKLYRKYRKRKNNDFDLLGFKIAKLQKTVKYWDLEDEDGAPIDCTPENIRVVYLTHPTLLNKASDRADKLFSDEEAADDEDLGSS